MNHSHKLAGGFLIILGREDAKALFGCRTDEATREFVVHLLANESTVSLALDGQWRPLARFFGDGSDKVTAGEPPLVWCFGGRSMYRGTETIISLVRPDMVGHLATALDGVDGHWLNARAAELAAITKSPLELPLPA